MLDVATLAQIVRSLLMAALSYVVPKRRRLLVFYPTFSRSAYGGNLAPVFERLVREHPDIDCLWLTSSEATAARLAASGLPARLCRRYPLLTLLRADAVVLDSFAQSLAFGRFRLFQLWHGTGFKAIGLLNPNRRGLRRFLHRHHYGKYAFVLAESEADRARKAESFSNGNVVVTGSPRNDVFAAPRASRPGFGLAVPFERLIAYCPTYRESGAAPAFSDGFWPRLEAVLEAGNAALLVKRHPKDVSLAVPAGLARVADVTAAVGDVQALLVAADVLVTDYSSIATDYALTGRPIVFYVYDFDAYVGASRALHYDLEAVLPGPFVRAEDDLLARLADLTWFDDDEYQRRYRAFQAMFHHFRDADAAGRVAEALAARL